MVELADFVEKNAKRMSILKEREFECCCTAERIDLLAILEKDQNRTVFCYILSNFRICTILMEALTPLDRTSCIKMYKNNARSSLFCRKAKRSIEAIAI